MLPIFSIIIILPSLLNYAAYSFLLERDDHLFPTLCISGFFCMEAGPFFFVGIYKYLKNTLDFYVTFMQSQVVLSFFFLWVILRIKIVTALER